jgi:hypothetical protein
MSEDNEYEFTIYHNGVQIVFPVHGEQNFLLQRMFLDRLVARTVRDGDLPLPVPHQPIEFYFLSNEQYESYMLYRETLKRSRSDQP